MTDGIIQKVFKQYKLDSMNMREQARLINILSLVEQELIEKIKQADTKNPDWDYTFSIGVKLMKIYLIGNGH